MKCPKCNYKFPFFLRNYEGCISKGIFFSPWLKCLKCETTLKLSVSWLNAIWALPLGFLVIKGGISMLRKLDFIVQVYQNHPLIYGGLVGGVCGLVIAAAFQKSMKLVQVNDNRESSS